MMYPIPPPYYYGYHKHMWSDPQEAWCAYHHGCGCYNHSSYYPPYTFHPFFYPHPHGGVYPPPLPPQPFHSYHSCGCNHLHQPQTDNNTSHSHYPLSVNHPQPSKNQTGNAHMPQHQPNRFPFNIFCLGKDTKDNNIHSIPNTTVNNNEAECHTSSNPAVQKVLPLKQANTNQENNNPRSIHTNSDSLQKTASPKTSKLPPVCLRIDPLPRNKKPSRSPSPPEKETSAVNPPNSSQEKQQSQVLNKSKEEQTEVNVKAIDHAKKPEQPDLANCAKKVEQPNLAHHAKKVQQPNLAHHANKVEQAKANYANHGDVPRNKGEEGEKRKVEEKKNISQHEAASIIQSVYRGFQVRKSQPLKKLRQINQVRKSVSELRNRIHDLETSSSTIGLDNKNAVIIGETIMSLLLKLDTIQGLHPLVREVRKSVAKELVGLQEKLDSLVKSVTPSEGTNCSPQQVMHPEDDGKLDQAQAQTSLCESIEHKDDVEACNILSVEPQLEKSSQDSIQDKFNQAPTESDTVTCENHEVEATELEEDCNTVGEPHMESYKEKINQAPSECDEALGLCENHEVEASEPQEGCNTLGEPQMGSDKEKFDQTPSECDEALRLCDNHEVRATESEKGCNIIGEPSHEEKLDQAPTEFYEAQGFHKENHHVEGSESQEGCDTTGLELNKGLQLESHKDQVPDECENHEMEATESPEGCNTSGVETRDDADDMKLKEVTEEVNKKQVESEDLVRSGEKANEGDGRLIEENEKLRAAVEELMKAGNDQLGVIRELTGRVKDLEKKLSKKKKKKVKVNKGRRVRDCVV